MSSELILGVRLDLQTLTTIKLSDINFKTKVAELKYETAGRVNLSKELFGKIYFFVFFLLYFFVLFFLKSIFLNQCFNFL